MAYMVITSSYRYMRKSLLLKIFVQIDVFQLCYIMAFIVFLFAKCRINNIICKKAFFILQE